MNFRLIDLLTFVAVFPFCLGFVFCASLVGPVLLLDADQRQQLADWHIFAFGVESIDSHTYFVLGLNELPEWVLVCIAIALLSLAGTNWANITIVGLLVSLPVAAVAEDVLVAQQLFVSTVILALAGLLCCTLYFYSVARLKKALSKKARIFNIRWGWLRGVRHFASAVVLGTFIIVGVYGWYCLHALTE